MSKTQSKYIFKYIIIGNPSVGKSCILNQLLNNKFSDEYEITVGVEFGAKNILLENNTQIKLQIWDTAGQESFKSVTRGYYRSSAVAIICYDITSEKSFQDVQNWIEECRMNANYKVVLVLVGNKIDLDGQRVISTQQGKEFAQENNMLFFETSAKDGSNIQQVFEESAEIVHRKILDGEIDPTNDQCGVKEGFGYRADNNIDQVQKNNKKQGCC